MKTLPEGLVELWPLHALCCTHWIRFPSSLKLVIPISPLARVKREAVRPAAR